MQPRILYSVTYEKTQSNRVSDFRDFVCFLVFFFDFYFIMPITFLFLVPAVNFIFLYLN